MSHARTLFETTLPGGALRHPQLFSRRKKRRDSLCHHLTSTIRESAAVDSIDTRQKLLEYWKDGSSKDWKDFQTECDCTQ